MLSLSNSHSAQALPTRYSRLHDTTRSACYRGLSDPALDIVFNRPSTGSKRPPHHCGGLFTS